jgi:hypothetical protein
MSIYRVNNNVLFSIYLLIPIVLFYKCKNGIKYYK